MNKYNWLDANLPDVGQPIRFRIPKGTPERLPVTPSSTRRTFGIKIPMRVGLLDRLWIPSPRRRKLPLVDTGEFRTLSEDASRFRPLVGRDFQVWELPARDARDGKTCRNCRLGARLGAAASGLYSQWVSDLEATPPGVRKAGCREVMEVLRSPGRRATHQVLPRIPIVDSP